MGIFHDSSSSNHTCPAVNAPVDPVQVPVVAGLTFHHLIIIISGACMAFTCLISFYAIVRHATHFSLPKEQKQIIRILFMIPVFAVVTFLSVCFYSADIYIKPVEDLYEAFALASFFLLLCQFVHEDDNPRYELLISTGTTKQYISATIGAFQFPVAMVVELLVTDITQATGSYCITSNKPYFAKIWMTVLNMISTTVAIVSILGFYKATKSITKSRKPLSKLVAFKAIIGLSFIQTTIFSFLRSGGDLKPTSHYTFNDLAYGVPNLLLSVELVVFALAHLYVFRTSPYYYKSRATVVQLGHGGYRGGFLGIRAIGEALNLVDIVRGILSIPAAISQRRAVGGAPSSRSKTGTTRPYTEYESLEMNPQYGSGPAYPHASHPQAGYAHRDAYDAMTPLNQDTGYHK